MDIKEIKSGKIKNLSRENLFEANLIGANLSGANLSGANLFGANLDKATYGNGNIRFKIKNQPIQIKGLKYPILIFCEEGYIQAGCYLKSAKAWRKIKNFDDQEFLDRWKDKILSFLE